MKTLRKSESKLIFNLIGCSKAFLLDSFKFHDDQFQYRNPSYLIQLRPFSFIKYTMYRALAHVNYNYFFSAMQNSYVTGLKLKNSLTGKLEQFVPMNGRIVKWYTCGPTVYSHSHMGHARNYICNDMIRRVMNHYFKYNVQLCMNITDVEDKIIDNSNKENIEYFEFARKWEALFFEDMEKLGVIPPDYTTRVTEYIPEIIKFIERIVDNGYAYESNNSVYFDIQEYKKKFDYGKLKRMQKAETQKAQTNEKNQKRNKEDFALWKAAKPGEPTWKSKWGEGRPGWHIECSAMASQVMGDKIDIHSGGIDLIFPHHENQLAQSQAYFNQKQWIKYFIHVGHLHIEGLKMSKSLKNFITIKELVKTVSPRVIKLYFFMHRYDVILDYDPKQSLQEAQGKDLRYKNVFANLKAAIRQRSISDPQKVNENDLQFDKSLENTKERIFEAFCDNINTPGVLKAIDEEIKKVNIYISSKQAKIALIQKAYDTLIEPFQVMGLQYKSTDQKSEGTEEAILNALVRFRDRIRQNAKSDFKKILDICDEFRDYDMVELNIRLEDKQTGEPSTWKPEPKEILLKERQKKIEAKLKKEEEKRKKQEQKLKKMKIKPQQMFLENKEYTKFDENGIPTHVADKKSETGDKQINDKLRKKLIKEWEAQKTLNEKYEAQNAQKNKQ